MRTCITYISTIKRSHLKNTKILFQSPYGLATLLAAVKCDFERQGHSITVKLKDDNLNAKEMYQVSFMLSDHPLANVDLACLV